MGFPDRPQREAGTSYAAVSKPTPVNVAHCLIWLWRSVLSRRRRLQAGLVVIFMLFGAVAELITIGAVIPFLAIFADPEGFGSSSRFGPVLASLGIPRTAFSVETIGLIFCGVAIVAAIVRIMLAWISQRYVFRIGFDIGAALYEQMLHQPYAFHIEMNSSRIIASVENIQKLLTKTFIPLMQSCTALVIGSLIITGLIVLSPVLASIAFGCFAAIYGLMSLVTRPRLRRNAKIMAAANRSRVQAVQEGLGGIRDVLIDNAQKLYVRKFTRVDNSLRKAQGTNALIVVAPRFVAEAAGMILLVVLAIVASRSGDIDSSLPVLGALALGAQRLLPLFQYAYRGWASLMGNSALLENVVDLLKQPVSSRFAGERSEVPPLHEALELHHVCFRYSPDKQPALQDINLCIPRGARIGLVGRSGSGKTTLMDLLMGLLQPTTGWVSVDGVRLDESNILSWQQQVAHVPQHIFLLDSTILENVAFGTDSSRIDLDRVREACRLAELDEFVMASPNGYDTFVGERGVRLSGGQRQRIGIARALYKKSTILILDEATSALDDSTEASVIDAVQRLGREYTVLMVAHRVTTLRQCDTIYRLDSGRICQSGTYDEVLGQPVAARG